MKPISEIRKKDIECKHYMVSKAVGGFPGHSHVHSTGNQYCLHCSLTVDEIISSAESRLLEVILEKIEGMLILENHPISYSAKIIHGERADGLEEGYNRALFDLKSYIQEGMKALPN